MYKGIIDDSILGNDGTSVINHNEYLNSENDIINNSVETEETISSSVIDVSEQQFNSIDDSIEIEHYDVNSIDVYNALNDSEIIGSNLIRLTSDTNHEYLEVSHPLDVDSLANIPHTDGLNISDEDINNLQERVNGVTREPIKDEISFGAKNCSTRHGCSGATACDASYGAYKKDKA